MSQRESHRLQQIANSAKHLRVQNKSMTPVVEAKTKPPPTNVEELVRLSIPKQGPTLKTGEINVRSQQISEAVKAEHDLIEAVHNSANEIRSKVVGLLNRHLTREERRKIEFEKLRMDLWSRVIDNYLVFQEEENFPKEYRLLERVTLKKIVNDFYEFWFLRATHAYVTNAMVLFMNNIESHYDEINSLPEDERERGILGLIDVYISTSEVKKCEDILMQFPYPTTNPAYKELSEEEDDDSADEEAQAEEAANDPDSEAAKKIRRKKLREEIEKEEITLENVKIILEDKEKTSSLIKSVKEAAVLKGWENSRDILDTHFTKAIEEFVPVDDESEEEDVVVAK